MVNEAGKRRRTSKASGRNGTEILGLQPGIAPAGYGDWVAALKVQIREARLRASLSVNVELVSLYWRIGRDILERQERLGWGAKIVERLALDLRSEFRGMQGFSRANLLYMRAFAQAWPDPQIVQRVVGRLPWGQNIELLTKLKDPAERLWYAEAATSNEIPATTRASV
jgi:predicted nuclease of restriction endonuclease-like (RecB) superfamily